MNIEYLVFLAKGLGLIGALTASLYFSFKKKTTKIQKPIKTKDGNFLIENNKELEKEVNYDAKIEIDLEANPDYARLPDPKGKPTVGPR